MEAKQKRKWGAAAILKRRERRATPSCRVNFLFDCILDFFFGIKILLLSFNIILVYDFVLSFFPHHFAILIRLNMHFQESNLNFI